MMTAPLMTLQPLLGLQLPEALAPIAPHLERWGTIYLPILLKLLGVLLVGYIVTRILRAITRRLLERVHIDALSDRMGILTAFERLRIPPPSQLLPRLVFWLGMGMTLYLAADVTNLTLLKKALGAAIAFVPTLLTALAIFGAGFLGAELLKKVLHKALVARDSSEEIATILPQLVYFTVIILTAAMSAGQLGLDVTLINRIIVFTIIAMALALSLSIALGAVPIMQQFVSRYHVLRSFALQDEISIQGLRGTIVRFAPTVVIVELRHDAEGADDTLAERLFIPYKKLLGSTVLRSVNDAPSPSAPSSEPL